MRKERIADETFRAAQRRIEWLTLVVAAGAGLVALWRWGGHAALGLALGAVLAWVNFVWLKQGVNAMAHAATRQASAERVRIPKMVYVKFFGRFVLLLGVLCVILWGSLLPAAAVFAGLFTLVAAVLVEMIYELVRGLSRQNLG